MLTHGADGQVIDHADAFFCKYLNAGGALLQIFADFDTGKNQKCRYKTRGNGGLRNGNAAEDRNGKVYKCTINTYIHKLYSPDFLKNSVIVMVGRTNTRGTTRAMGLHKPLFANANRTKNNTAIRTG